ncbi:MAG: hypothetical protein MJ163_02920, partial [Alphaproteobacteria bacterium]|nr:hypothetical protein [Alphaproteobacteria bacterium]
GYTRVEYIQSSGTQYIKTSIIADLNTKADIKFAKTQENGYSAVFGARTSATSRAFNAWVPLSSGFIGANLSSNGSIASNVHCTTNTLYVLSLSGTQLSVNGNITTITSASSFTTPGGLWLFNTNGGGTSTSGTSNRVFVGKIYYFNVYQSDNLVLELIPAKRNSDNVVGMWDTVSKTFFTNAGTGSFIAGPVVSD